MTQDLAIRAMMAMLGSGTNALPCLAEGLTGRHPDLTEPSQAVFLFALSRS